MENPDSSNYQRMYAGDPKGAVEATESNLRSMVEANRLLFFLFAGSILVLMIIGAVYYSYRIFVYSTDTDDCS